MGKTIAIDGKTICNSQDGNGQPLHLVSAFATEASLVLGQLKTNGKGGELAGIQKLLEILDLKGAVITVDAGGCHKVVAQKVTDYFRTMLRLCSELLQLNYKIIIILHY